MVTTVLAMILVLGLAVDLGGRVHAQQRAQTIAVEAARSGGQQLQGPAAVLGHAAVVDGRAAVAAANTYLAGAANVTGTAAADGTRVVVDTSSVYRTQFLGLIGINNLTVSGHAEVQVSRAVGGVVQ